jgi:hypothetical protein
MFKRLMWIGLIVLALGMSACAKEADPVDEVEPNDDEEVLVSLELPSDYPSEVLPIYPNGFVEVAMSLNKSYTIVVYYKEAPSVLIEYYKDLVKDAEDLMVTETAGTYTAFGELDDHTFALDIGTSTSYKDYPTSLSLTLTYNQK